MVLPLFKHSSATCVVILKGVTAGVEVAAAAALKLCDVIFKLIDRGG